MGFFDKLFGNKAEEEETAKFFGQSKTVLAPIRGKVLAQADIPDETFAQGILGPGCGIEPTGKTVYAPFDGTVNQVASTPARRRSDQRRRHRDPGARRHGHRGDERQGLQGSGQGG